MSTGGDILKQLAASRRGPGFVNFKGDEEQNEPLLAADLVPDTWARAEQGSRLQGVEDIVIQVRARALLDIADFKKEWRWRELL